MIFEINQTFRTMNYAAMAKANTQSDKKGEPQRSGSMPVNGTTRKLKIKVPKSEFGRGSVR